jgi:hypothetical protein
MTPEQRAAFAAGCAQRVYDLYERHAKPYRDNVWEALVRAWDRAAGHRPSEELVKRLVAELDEESSNYASILDQTLELPFEVIVAASLALEAAHCGAAQKAYDAANFALGAVGRTDEGPSDAGVSEELAWQLDWLGFCRAADSRSAHAELERRTATDPDWYVRWTR